MSFFDLGIGDLLGAGAKLAGGFIGEKSADQRAAQNIAAQREFAQNAISWKVADARRAGISPLAALGASTTSFSNVVGGEAKVGEAVGDMGQDISRAATAYSNREQKTLLLKGAALDLEGKGLDNDIKRAELADKVRKVTSPGSPPGVNMPSTGVLPGGSSNWPITTSVPIEPKDKEEVENQLRMWGINLANDPWTSDAQTAQNVVGDWGENMWTFPKIGSIIAYNLARWANRRRQDVIRNQGYQP